MSRRLKFIVEYFGAPFAGFQRQDDQTTVQGVLEHALEQITGHAHTITVAGRTDAGVHATGQVCHVDTESDKPLRELLSGLNHFAKPHISVLDLTEAAPDFHARFSATMRHYCYKILNRPSAPAIWHERVTHIREPLDVSAMQAALKNFKGELDCSSLRTSQCQSKTPMCFIQQAEIIQNGELIELHISANHFLHNMIRITMGTLVDIGRGKLQPADFDRIIAAQDRSQAGPTLGPAGLYLTQVDY